MSPVSTSNDSIIGYTSKLGNGLSFDPIAARNPDRPKFRLDDYKANEPREAEPPRTASKQSNSDRKTAAPQNQHQPDNTPDNADTNANVKDTKTDVSGDAVAKTEKAQAGKDAQVNEAQTNTSKPQDGQPNNTPTTNTKSAEAQTEEASVDTPAPDIENAESETTDQSPEESAVTAPIVKNEVSVPEQEIARPPSATAAQGPSEEAPIATNVKQDEPTKAAPAAAPTEDQKAGATPATTSRDPKLAALEKLTKTGENAVATTPRTVSNDDTTTFKLPVPWPPQAQSETTQGSQTKTQGDQTKQSSTASQVVPVTQKATDHPQPTAPTQINQTAAVPEQAKNIPVSPNESLPPEANKQAAVPAATKATGETAPKIEIVSQAPAKPAATNDIALITNNRTATAEGSAKPAVLPTPSETIAAATALNSRPAQSNALGGSNVKRSNAVTASNENNGAKASANQGQQNPAIVSQTTQANPAATAFTAASQVQSAAVTSPEQLASVRQQSSSTQRGQTDQSGTTSSTSRPADLPAQGSGSGFADSLRTASTDRTAASQDRQTLPTPATEQVKVKLIKAAQGGLDKIKIQLNPSELGKVEVRLEIGSDGAIRGTVIAEKPETMDLLQRDAKQLERALQDAGFKTGGDSLDFQMRGGGTNERQQSGSGNGSLSQDGGDLDGSDEQPATDTTGSEHDGIGDDGSLNLVA